MDGAAINILPGRIGRVITGNGNEGTIRTQRNSLDHQRVINPHHIDPIAEPRTMIRSVHEHIITVRQGRFHGIAHDADYR